MSKLLLNRTTLATVVSGRGPAAVGVPHPLDKARDPQADESGNIVKPRRRRP